MDDISFRKLFCILPYSVSAVFCSQGTVPLSSAASGKLPFLRMGGSLCSAAAAVLSTGVTYAGGLLLEKKKNAPVYWLFFAANILILLICKYMGFAMNTVAAICSRLYLPVPEGTWSIVAPVGLSFYIFQSTTYLSDIYRKGLEAEVNPARYAAFVSFFPTILSGPIQKSRDLLPQLKNPPKFTFEKAQKGLMLLVWGYFVKVVVANRLSYVVNLVFNDYTNYDGIYYLIAAVCFSSYIYCDFSSYSDMAR